VSYELRSRAADCESTSFVAVVHVRRKLDGVSVKTKDHQNENMKFDFEPSDETQSGNGPRNGPGGLGDEAWQRVRAALEFAREYDRTRKLLLEMKPLSTKVQ
jgi:hypothetical protein